MNIDLDKLNLRELNSLLAAAIKRRNFLSQRAPIAVVRRRLTAIAASAGYTIGEVMWREPSANAADKKTPRRRKSSKVAAKYRDPDNKRNTWSGRGRMPIWLVEKTKRGRSAADFLIPGLAKPTVRDARKIGQKSVFKAE